MSEALTARQQEVLDFMLRFYEREHVHPTLRDIAAEFDIASLNGVMCHIRALVKKGAVKAVIRGNQNIYIPAMRTLYVTCPHCDGEIEVEEEL